MVNPVRDGLVVAFLEELLSQLTNPLLNAPQGAYPAAEGRPEQKSQNEHQNHQNERRFMDFLCECAYCCKLIEGYHTSKGANCVQ